MPVVTTHKDGDVLVVVSDNPPVNALGAAVRQGLVEAIATAASDAEVKAVVIVGHGKTFFAGADITEFGRPPVAPMLPDVVDAIEASAKPVVAAIHGTALGGGLEVALGAHYRVAVPSARLGLPEVKLGILPGAGGTQRLPRLIGVEAALQMITDWRTTFPRPRRRKAIGLVDAIIDGRGVAGRPTPSPSPEKLSGGHGNPVSSQRTGELTAKVDRTRRSSTASDQGGPARRSRSGFLAPQKCVDAVKARHRVALSPRGRRLEARPMRCAWS